MLHRRYPTQFTPEFLSLISTSLKPQSAATIEKEGRDKKALLRLYAELELCGIVEDGSTFAVVKEIVRGPITRRRVLGIDMCLYCCQTAHDGKGSDYYGTARHRIHKTSTRLFSSPLFRRGSYSRSRLPVLIL